uniref:Uncharacterized protein n=1 Tax=Xiphophorus couchianus TaxID=32473 RepID=A0A3B5LYQ9_9TELE
MREFVCLPLQDALLRLAAVVDVRSLRVGAHMSLFDFVCQECVCIFVLEGDSRLLCDDPPYEVPQEGKLRCVPDNTVLST